MDISTNDRYISWVNRILFQAGKSYQISTLNDVNICNGKILFSVFEYLSNSKVPGYVNVNSNRAVLYNLQMLLNRVASLKIRMSLIQPKDIEDGDEESISRFILGLIRHYQPHLIRPRVLAPPNGSSTRNPEADYAQPRPGRPASASRSYETTRSRKSEVPIRLSGKSKFKRIISAQRPSSEMSKTVVTESRVRRLSDSSTIVNQSLPRDIQEIHIQLTELKKLLSRPDFVYEHQTERKDKSCQTDKIDMINGDHLYHRECMITKLQDQLHNLRANLDNRNKIAESFAKELTILRAQQSRRSVEIEPKVLDPFIGLLKSIRNDKKLNNLDLDKFDEGINLIMSLSMSHRNQVDKTNIAIINPCSQTISETSKEDPSQYLIISQTTDSQTTDEQPNSFITDFKGSTEKAETKMVFFLGESTTPYLSNIPLSSSQITLAKVKEYTSSMLSKDRNLRYFFKTINSDFGPAKEEIVRDQDIVPHIDGKILVFIQ